MDNAQAIPDLSERLEVPRGASYLYSSGRNQLHSSGGITGTPPMIWEITSIVILGLLATDYFFHIRKARIPPLGELSPRSAISVGIALLFG